MKKPREYKGYLFEDNGYGDLFNGEVDKFLIFRPYPLMVDTVIHKDGSVTMNQEKFKENTDEKKGVYEEGIETHEDGSVFVKAEDVTQNIKEESKDNRTDVSEETIDDNIEVELDSDDREKLEGLIGYGIPQDVADEFQEITGEQSYAIENAIGLLADDLIGYEEFNDFEEEYGIPGDYDRLDNLEYDLSEYMANHDIDEDLKTQVERYIGDAEEQATQDIEEEIQNYLDGHTVKVEEKAVTEEPEFADDYDRQIYGMTKYDKGEISYDELVDTYFYGDGQDAGDALHDFGSTRIKEETPPEMRAVGEETNPSGVLPNEQEYRFDFGFKDGSSLRSDSFEEAKAYLEEEDMAQYLDGDLKDKIDSVKWVLDDVDAVHVDVKANQELSLEDMQSLKDFIEGQNSDGLGEGFEQQKFAESYYDPDTGEGPYSYQEMMDIVQENYDNMDADEWIDYIGEDDLMAAEDEYIDMNYDVDDIISAIETDYDIDEDEHERLSNMDMGDISMELQDRYPDAEYHIRENVRQEIIDDPESYLDDNAIGTAKDEVARNDARFNETLWGEGMTSMEWDIPDGVNVTKPVEERTDFYNRLSDEDKVKYNDYIKEGYSTSDIENTLMYETQQERINNKLSPDDEDRIAEEEWQKAANTPANTDDEKLERALRMSASDKIGYEVPLSSIISGARHNYSGNKTDEEIAPLARRIANEYGLHYEDDMGSNLRMSKEDFINFLSKENSSKSITFDEYRMSLAKDRYEKGYNANDLSSQDLKDIQDYREMKEAYKVDDNILKSLERAYENNPTAKVVTNIDTGKKYIEVGNGQFRSMEDGMDYNLDFNAENNDLPKYQDETGRIINDNPRAKNYYNPFVKKMMIEKETNSVFSQPGKEWEVIEEGSSAYGNKLYKVKDSSGQIQWKDADELEELNDSNRSIRDGYRTKQELYKAYQNGEMSFEEYEERVRKLARR